MVVIRYLKTSIVNKLNKHNKNALILFLGSTGSGKSYAALSTGEETDPNFSIENVVFSPKDFMTLLNSGKVKKGSVIIIDEAGVGLSARNFWKESNKEILNVLQTFRYRNIGVLFTVPNMSYIDKGVRGLFHHMVNMRSIDSRNKTSKGKIYRLKIDNRTGKTFTIFPKMFMNGMSYVLKFIRFKLPSKKLIGLYEAKKAKFSEILNLKAEGVLAKMEADTRKKIRPRELAADIFRKGIKNFLTARKYRGALRADVTLIATEYEIGDRQAYRVKRMVDNQLEDMRARGEVDY